MKWPSISDANKQSILLGRLGTRKRFVACLLIMDIIIETHTNGQKKYYSALNSCNYCGPGGKAVTSVNGDQIAVKIKINKK